MSKYFVFILVSIIFCFPCFAEEMPSVPELIKKMYDYRLAIENMKAEVTVSYPVDTVQPVWEKIKQHFYFVYSKGKVRCDRTWINSKSGTTSLYQDLFTPEFYFLRHPHNDPDINDGNGLSLFDPQESPFNSLDLRRIGTDRGYSFDTILISRFDYDTLLDNFYSPKGENFVVSTDLIDGEKLYKVSYQIKSAGLENVYWISSQKGYHLVRSETKSEKLDLHSTYIVTLSKSASQNGDIWFPKEVVFKQSAEGSKFEERIVVDSVAFDVQDETPFTLTDLKIPVGYSVYVRGETKYWDGNDFVKQIPYTIEPVRVTSRKAFWIINAIGFAVIVISILMKWLRCRYRR